MITLTNAKAKLTGGRVILLSPVYGLKKKKWYQFFDRRVRFFELTQAVTVELSDGRVITIPEGFRTDLSSVPRWLWSVAAPYGDFLLAAIIHDYLYVNNIGSRGFADREMLTWSQQLCHNTIDNKLRYYAVHWFGRSWWNHEVSWK